jgi:protein arginine kinase activator
MRCDECGNAEAVIPLTLVQDNESRTMHLCAACAEARGIPGSEPLPESMLLSGLLAQFGPAGVAGAGELGPSGASSHVPVPACPFCGLTIRKFKETGRLGCPQCWSAFEPQLQKLLRRIHGATHHAGKVYLPPNPTASDRGRRLEGLRRKLQRAVEMEDFEWAAQLRDRILELERDEVTS